MPTPEQIVPSAGCPSRLLYCGSSRRAEAARQTHEVSQGPLTVLTYFLASSPSAPHDNSFGSFPPSLFDAVECTGFIFEVADIGMLHGRVVGVAVFGLARQRVIDIPYQSAENKTHSHCVLRSHDLHLWAMSGELRFSGVSFRATPSRHEEPPLTEG